MLLRNDMRITHSRLLRFTFTHCDFGENRGQYKIPEVRRSERGAEAVVSTLINHVEAPDWRETSLLCLGALSKSHGSPEGAAAVIEGLLNGEPTAQGQAALLCGLALRDIGTGGVTADCFEHARGVLLERMRAQQGVPAPTRIECGEVLADLGDPRLEVTTLDGMQFCLVPAGSGCDAQGEAGSRRAPLRLRLLDRPPPGHRRPVRSVPAFGAYGSGRSGLHQRLHNRPRDLGDLARGERLLPLVDRALARRRPAARRLGGVPALRARVGKGGAGRESSASGTRCSHGN
jgi:hypothetical protein